MADEVDDLVGATGEGRVEQLGQLAVPGREIHRGGGANGLGRRGRRRRHGRLIDLRLRRERDLERVQLGRSGQARRQLQRARCRRRRTLERQAEQLLVDVEAERHVDLGARVRAHHHDRWRVGARRRRRQRGRSSQWR